ncbi:hypothetical protein OUZ56_024359 [Daphnia magna]|uniref:UBN2 domain-containing protein n=1 Tax=Daphnia magna TaxID=35525 RepID=A0ABR0B0M7_9CRUS|nr:hypothetical protein OUZ56_024359 [Daphnia magna]
MWLKIETQYASNAADLENNCLTSLYNFKYDSGKDIMSHINGVLAFTNKLREIGKPMQELHIINIILSSLPESYKIELEYYSSCGKNGYQPNRETKGRRKDYCLLFKASPN